MNLESHIHRAMAFSVATFGPDKRRRGVIDHIRKELMEIDNAPDDDDPAKEWVDVLILAIDGLWRELHHQGVPWDMIPSVITGMLCGKQGVNEQRNWPNWREQSDDHAIEHI